MKAWHFLNEDKILKYGDNRKVRKGATYEADLRNVYTNHTLLLWRSVTG